VAVKQHWNFSKVLRLFVPIPTLQGYLGPQKGFGRHTIYSGKLRHKRRDAFGL